MPEFGELLRRLRGDRSQRDVAKELGMPVTTLSTLENQDTVPRGPMLKRLCDYYGVPPMHFYGGSTAKMKPSDSALAWLTLVRENTIAKETIATYAPADFPDDMKKQLAERIRQKKYANSTNVKQDV